MPSQNRTVRPGRTERTVLADSGELLPVPDGWSLLPPGDGPLTKMVKAKGPTWQVRVKYRNRFISRGIWAREEHIAAGRAELQAKRSAPDYGKKRQQQLATREKKQRNYAQDFYTAVLDFLDFHRRYSGLAVRLARAVTEQSTPIGSGTVARTGRIPLDERARSAVIAWMRHQTTGYERMTIAPVKGKRRQLRRELACQSIGLLHTYRAGIDVPHPCPLQEALASQEPGGLPGSLSQQSDPHCVD